MQMVDNARVVVYLMTGFLESGKTQFLRYTLGQEYFEIDGNTVLILCEEGEEEYGEDLLKRSRTTLLTVDDPEDITLEWLEEVEQKYKPERVIFECNGMYPVSKMEALEVPKGWGLVQKLTMVDASTFGTYIANMKPLFMDMVRNAELVMFNRCTKDMPLASYRRSVKVVNQSAQIIFEDEEGEIDNIFEDSMPYDLDAPVVQIDDMDYGIWYVDMMDHPERYLNKTVEYKAKVLKPRGFGAKEFVAGRMAMTCCADDTTFLGYICRSAYAPKLSPGQWVKVKGTVGYEYTKAYRRKGPVIKAEFVEASEDPEDEMVYFN
ncbi:GTP-binding protein [Mordavella massiliensis]|uniref:TIGR03943 family putative permease subunit n=1 Tax=Mordavella massiliensis TaxID=1871024 RepID=UPI00210AEB05|nr:GTPase [Mordavella massiliensis]